MRRRRERDAAPPHRAIRDGLDLAASAGDPRARPPCGRRGPTPAALRRAGRAAAAPVRAPRSRDRGARADALGPNPGQSRRLKPRARGRSTHGARRARLLGPGPCLRRPRRPREARARRGWPCPAATCDSDGSAVRGAGRNPPSRRGRVTSAASAPARRTRPPSGPSGASARRSSSVRAGRSACVARTPPLGAAAGPTLSRLGNRERPMSGHDGASGARPAASIATIASGAGSSWAGPWRRAASGTGRSRVGTTAVRGRRHAPRSAPAARDRTMLVRDAMPGRGPARERPPAAHPAGVGGPPL